jgi:N-acyl-D-amino-acid deacylase
MLNLLIKNVEIIDGTGEASYAADVGVSGGRIVEIAKGIETEAERTIEGDGLYLAPGFIDPHMHSGLTLFGNKKAESSIRQGVTTEIVGNCGMSGAPLYGKAIDEVAFLKGGLDFDITWNSMGEYLEQLEKSGSSLNVVPLVGHNTIRQSVIGLGADAPTPEQQIEMETLMAEAMEQGGRGLSTGLFYPPGCYADTDEVIGLAKVAAKYGGIYATHIRSESDEVLSAAEEALDIGLQAGLPVEFSHIKISGYRNWEMIDELMGISEGDKAKDLQLVCDQYPYNASSTMLMSILPLWAQEGGSDVIAKRARDKEIRAVLRKDWEENQIEWDNRSGVRDWSGIQITDSPSRPEVIGMTIQEIAIQDKSDPFDVSMDLIALDGDGCDAVYFDQQEEIVQRLMQHPLVVIGSDSLGSAPYGVLGQNKPHPRGYGTFPRVLGYYVREQGILSLESAIKKMTSMTAEHFNLVDRGVIREGAWADLVLFDRQTVIDKATFTEPHQYSSGIHTVIVNGEVVIDKGEHTGKLPGAVL